MFSVDDPFLEQSRMKEETSKAAGGEETNEIRIGNVALRARKEVPFVVFWGGKSHGCRQKTQYSG